MSYLLLFLTNISDVRIQLGTLLADIGLINLPKSSEVESKKVVSPRDITIVSPLSILLFSGSIYVHHQSGSVTIDGWLKLAEPAQTAVLFKEFWLTLHSILKDLIQKPEKSGIVHNEVVKSMAHLLIEESKAQPKTALGKYKLYSRLFYLKYKLYLQLK